MPSHAQGSLVSVLLIALAVGSTEGCKNAPSAEPTAAAASSATITSATPAPANDELRGKLVGRWIEVRDGMGNAIAPEFATVEEIHADGTLSEVDGTRRSKVTWKLTDVKGNTGVFQKEMEAAGMKLATDPLPFELTDDGTIAFRDSKIRWTRQDAPPEVATSAQMKAFMALLDGKPGSGARAAKAFGAPSAKDALKDLAETDTLAVRVVRMRRSGAETCYALLANGTYQDVCWRNGKVVSAEDIDRYAPK